MRTVIGDHIIDRRTPEAIVLGEETVSPLPEPVGPALPEVRRARRFKVAAGREQKFRLYFLGAKRNRRL